ncbi:DUF4336 domain-containing protein [Cyanobium sp. AMD-g]|uniref:DUF4336 domain-containing protein n=1 Tax=Cyanobium sp. AMD-g TaxID=2823699 RepID=UPI0020CED422|nr:DUF4336 domain-containing protein [Cyanobium sp. AMD-g]MCP9929572.1 DUF4336 domain-containing protein [Cyanobium sp. AMD-g]
MSEPANAAATPSPADQRWPWWPLLPLYPYGRRRTLVRELVAGRLWSFEQVQGVWYVAVPIRMLVLRVREGLLLYAPVAPTAEVKAQLHQLEERHGPVCTIVLPTASGLEHKLPVPAMARAFPRAQVWVTPRQWSFPLPLPPAWLGFPADRTRVLLSDGVPHGDQLDWLPLGPLDLGLGTFLEIACFDRVSGSLLLTDALVAIPPEPPAVFDLDPTPLLFHARERGDEPLQDDPERRRRGWWRLVLFATYLRPRPLEVLPLAEVLRHCLAPGCRGARAHFGFYPFRWLPGWQADFEALTPGRRSSLQVAAVLERLVFPRQRAPLVAWIRQLAGLKELRWVVPAHHDAPVPTSGADLTTLADGIEAGDWAPDQGAWETLAGIDKTLVRLGLVPGEIHQSHKPQT